MGHKEIQFIPGIDNWLAGLIAAGLVGYALGRSSSETKVILAKDICRALTEHKNDAPKPFPKKANCLIAFWRSIYSRIRGRSENHPWDKGEND